MIKVNVSKFKAALGVACIAAAKRPVMPILSTVLIEAKPGTAHITLSCSDLDHRIMVPCEALTDKAMAVCVPAHFLSQCVGSLAADDMLLSHRNNQAVIVSGSTTFKLHATGPDEFPQLGESFKADGASVKFSHAQVRSALASVSPAASDDESKFVLRSVFANTHKGEASFVSTDGKRLHVFSNGVKIDVLKALLSVSVAEHLKALLSDSTEKYVTLYIGEARVVAEVDSEFGQISYAGKLIAGNYVNWQQVLPKTETFMTFSRDELAGAVRRASLQSSEKDNSVKFTVDGALMEVSASSPDSGDFSESLTGEGTESFSGKFVFLRHEFVLDALAACEGEKVQFYIGGDNSPTLIQCDAFKAVIMPIRKS